MSCFVFYIQVFCAELSRGTFSLRSEQVSQKSLSLIMSQVIRFFILFVCFGGGRWGWNLSNLKLTVNNITHPTPQKKKKKQNWENHNFALSVL